MADDLGQADDSDVVRVDNEIATRLTHGVAADAKELCAPGIASLAQLIT